MRETNAATKLRQMKGEAEHLRSSLLYMEREMASQKKSLARLEERISALQISQTDVLAELQAEVEGGAILSAEERLEMAKKLIRANGGSWYCDKRKAGGWSLKPDISLTRHKQLRTLLSALSRGKENVQVFKRPGHHCCLNAAVKDKATKEVLPATIRYWFQEE